MSQRDGFAGGFVLGTIFGGVVGGVVGAIVASRTIENELAIEEDNQINTNPSEGKKPSLKRRSVKALETDGMDMEVARRSLEDKIAQLNATIDEVRQQLGSVNSNFSQKVNERPVTKDS